MLLFVSTTVVLFMLLGARTYIPHALPLSVCFRINSIILVFESLNGLAHNQPFDPPLPLFPLLSAVFPWPLFGQGRRGHLHSRFLFT